MNGWVVRAAIHSRHTSAQADRGRPHGRGARANRRVPSSGRMNAVSAHAEIRIVNPAMRAGKGGGVLSEHCHSTCCNTQQTTISTSGQGASARVGSHERLQPQSNERLQPRASRRFY